MNLKNITMKNTILILISLLFSGLIEAQQKDNNNGYKISTIGISMGQMHLNQYSSSFKHNRNLINYLPSGNVDSISFNNWQKGIESNQIPTVSFNIQLTPQKETKLNYKIIAGIDIFNKPHAFYNYSETDSTFNAKTYNIDSSIITQNVNVSSSTWNYSKTETDIMLKIGLLIHTNQEKRFSFYSGLETGIGIAFDSKLDYLKTTKDEEIVNIYIQNQLITTEQENEDVDNTKTFFKQIDLPTSYSFSIAVPLGVNIRLAKKGWKSRTSINGELSYYTLFTKQKNINSNNSLLWSKVGLNYTI